MAGPRRGSRERVRAAEREMTMGKTWRERIVEAVERGKFTREDRYLAWGSWTTCAVGEQHAKHPEVVVMALGEERWAGPQDDVLFRLGDCEHGFAHAVWHNDIARAELLLDAIEDRVLQLKRRA